MMCYCFMFGVYMVVDCFRYFGRQVDLFNLYIDNFNIQCCYIVWVDDWNFVFCFSCYVFCCFGNGVICCWGSNFIFCICRIGVQCVMYFEGQMIMGIGDDVFYVQVINFRMQMVREFMF